MTWYWVSTPAATYGIRDEAGRIVETAPYARRLLGRATPRVLLDLRASGALVLPLPPSRDSCDSRCMAEQLLLWCDTETTGLDPEKGYLLEVALVITTPTLVVVDKASWVIGHDLEQAYAAADDYVKAMHDANGLWLDVAEGKPLAQVRDEALKFAQRTAPRAPLCGQSPQFDRAWLRRHMSDLERHWNHQHFDVTTLTHAAAFWGAPIPRTEVAHRALPDILESIHMAQAVRSRYFR